MTRELSVRLRALGAVQVLERLPSWAMPVLVFLAAIGCQITRRPDLFLRPQFYAEDGLFYAQAHELGALASLFTPSAGYINLLPRLVLGFAQVLPLAWGPAVCLAAAACVDALPAAFVVSRRMGAAIPSAGARLLLAALYVGLPNTLFHATVLTYSQWRLSLVAFMPLVAEPPATRLGRIADAAVMTLSGLSGPYCILLAPVAALQAAVRRSRRAYTLAGVVLLTACAQAVTLLTAGPAQRVSGSSGGSIGLLFRLVGGRVFYGATIGADLQAGSLFASGGLGSDAFIAGVGALGIVLLGIVAIAGSHELRMFLLYGAAILAAVLTTSSVPPGGPPAWAVLCHPYALSTYFIVPMLGVYASAVWMLGRQAPAARATGAAVLAVAALVGIPRDWRMPAVPDLNYPASVERYEAAPPGAAIPVAFPPDWTVTLTKR